MKRKHYVVLAVLLCVNLVGGAVYYVKANEKDLIRSNFRTIVRACKFIGAYPVSVYSKDKSKNKTYLSFQKPEFPSEADYRSPRNSSRSSVHHKPTDYLTYTVNHKEGFSKGQKTYNDSFSMKCMLGNDGVNPQELNEDSPVDIYFNGITLKSTLGEGNKTKNLDDAERGGMSVYNVNLKVG